MNERLNWVKINPEAYQGILAASKSTGSLDPKLKHLVDVRVSQINGCAYCLDMHAREARKAGESQYRLDCLAGWRDVPSFSAKERAALTWAEALTRIVEDHAPQEHYENLRGHFTDKEIVDLTVTIAVINTWNRTQIAMQILPPQELS